MKRTKKWKEELCILFVALALGTIFAFAALAQDAKPQFSKITKLEVKQASVKELKYVCFAGPDEVCASDLWVADYDRLRVLQKKYSPPQDVADQMAGMAQRLAQQIPPGYQWDDAKRRYVKIKPVIPSQPQPVPPTEKKQ